MFGDRPMVVQVPHAKELLGVRLVLWRNAQGAWSCFEDKCPPRLAPLSGIPLLSKAPSPVLQDCVLVGSLFD